MRPRATGIRDYPCHAARQGYQGQRRLILNAQRPWRVHQRAEQKRAANARSRNAPRVLRFRDVCHAGLSRTDNQVFVDAMQQINVAILNPWLAFILAGPPVFGIVTAVLHFQAGQRATVGWIGAALVLYVVALLITVGINVPLNDTLAVAGPPQRSLIRLEFVTNLKQHTRAGT